MTEYRVKAKYVTKDFGYKWVKYCLQKKVKFLIFSWWSDMEEKTYLEDANRIMQELNSANP